MSDINLPDPTGGSEATGEPDNTQSNDVQDTLNSEQEGNSQQQDDDTEGDNSDGEGDKPDPRITRANREAADYRKKLRAAEKAEKDAQAKLTEVLKGLSKLSGNEDEEQTPEQLIEAANKRATESEQRYNSLLSESTLNSALQKAGAEVELARAVVSASSEFKALDPTADDFAAQVDEIVTEAVEKYPKLSANIAAPSSGTPSSKSGNVGSKIKLEDLDKLSSDEIFELQKSGKLSHLF